MAQALRSRPGMKILVFIQMGLLVLACAVDELHTPEAASGSPATETVAR